MIGILMLVGDLKTKHPTYPLGNPNLWKSKRYLGANIFYPLKTALILGYSLFIPGKSLHIWGEFYCIVFQNIFFDIENIVPDIKAHHLRLLRT
jgi:hypothetical protein